MTGRVVWLAVALLAAACNFMESRWVLWGWTPVGGWVPINEYRTLDECNRFIRGPEWRCMPFGAVPTDTPSPPKR